MNTFNHTIFFVQSKRIVIVPIVLLFISCESFVAIDPPKNALVAKQVFADEAALASAVSGMYAQYYNYAMNTNYTLYGALQADELQYNMALSDYNLKFQDNALTEDVGQLNNIWSYAYKLIYIANAMMEGVTGNAALSQSSISQAKGEALFMRALIYFYLINGWDRVPLVTTTDYQVNRTLPLSEREALWGQIIADLEEAYALLGTEYPSSGKLRPNRHTVAALLAQAQLFREDWQQVIQLASEVIEAPTYRLEDDLNRVFIAESQEAIWQLKATGTNINTKLGQQLLHSRPKTTLASYVRDELLADFETGDKRMDAWITDYEYLDKSYHLPFKYKLGFYAGDTPEEYEVQFRLAELYLYRAEAYARLGDLDAAIEDLNVIRGRAGLTLLEKGKLSPEETLAAVWQEARIELMFENGHRWYDLKRTGRAQEVLGHIKPEFTARSLWYPIPLQQQLDNPALAGQ